MHGISLNYPTTRRYTVVTKDLARRRMGFGAEPRSKTVWVFSLKDLMPILVFLLLAHYVPNVAKRSI